MPTYSDPNILDPKPFEEIIHTYREFLDCDNFQLFDAELRRWKLKAKCVEHLNFVLFVCF